MSERRIVFPQGRFGVPAGKIFDFSRGVNLGVPAERIFGGVNLGVPAERIFGGVKTRTPRKFLRGVAHDALREKGGVSRPPREREMSERRIVFEQSEKTRSK